ncbi:MAG TPA: ABC transporter permease [Acidimicrobiales bacterium]|jgi:peptide/nickel transport system permease protein|nr:ABC transporter permease [Acidimicrobiales bacterium]
MGRLVGRRLLLAIPMLFIVVTATFLLEQLIPGDPASFVLGSHTTPGQLSAFDASIGLHRSLLDQYGSQLWGVLHGNLGQSWISRQNVRHLIVTALPVTLSLAVLATVVTFILGLGLGTLAALRRGRWPDRILQGVAGIGVGLPNFWLAIVLVLFFAIDTHLFPATGYVSFSTSPGSWASSLVLPVVAITFGSLAGVLLQVRSSMIDVLSQDYIRSLRANGIARRQIIFKHGLRNGAIPVVTTLGFVFVGLLAGTVVIEQVFNLPGLGSMLLNGVLTHDLPVVQGVVIVFAVVVVIVNLLVDLLAAALNPRLRRA